MSFDSEAVLSAAQFARITDRRVSDPTTVLWAARDRNRRDNMAPDGRLVILAADHPARRVVGVGDAPLAMGDRRDLLARILHVLRGGAADGVMATMDVLEDLLFLHQFDIEDGGPGFLHDTVLIASLNRGGLAGTVWEMNDPVTGPTAETCARMGMDGGKLLLRLCPDDPGSLRTMEACAAAVTQLNQRGLATFLEPLAAARTGNGFTIIRSAGEQVKAISVATALGDSSHNMWLKLPWCPDFSTVAASTSLPILLLGGPTPDANTSLLEQVQDAMAAGANVRGIMAGRTVLFPGDSDPLEGARALFELVHGS